MPGATSGALSPLTQYTLTEMTATANKSPGILPLLIAIACIGGAVMLSQDGDRPADAPTPGAPQEEVASLPPTVPGVEEWHAVADAQACYSLRERFRQMGRNVRLGRIDRRPRRSILPVHCQFRGKDAGKGNPFEDTRYNHPREYEP